MNGRVNKRIDKLVTILLQFEENMFFERQQKRLMWKPNRKFVQEQTRHEKGAAIPDEDIQVNNYAWLCSWLYS